MIYGYMKCDYYFA